MNTPLLSIVVPTMGRPASMQRLLRSLSVQHQAPCFEVVVVADGVEKTRAGVGDSRGWPFDVRVIESVGHGAAAARNTGARAAASHVLLFVDDDVEVHGGVVAAHAAFHAGGPERIGAGGLTPAPVATGFLGSALAGWWDVLDEQLSDPRHRFTFRDLLTGHCSMRRGTFERVGGFDESLRCHEDFDFGYRALQDGLSIRRVPGADAQHHDGSTLGKILARKREEGRAGVQLVDRYPPLRRALALGQPLVEGRVARQVQRTAIAGGRAGELVSVTCVAGLRVFETLRMRDKWRAALERAMDYWYWRGVLEQAGSREAVEALRPDGVTDETGPLLEIDLTHGLALAEARLDSERPGSLCVRLDGRLVGIVSAVAGAEPLRGVHLRPLLLKYMLPGYLRAAAAAGLLPDVLAGGVRETETTAPMPANRPADQVA